MEDYHVFAAKGWEQKQLREFRQDERDEHKVTGTMRGPRHRGEFGPVRGDATKRLRIGQGSGFFHDPAERGVAASLYHRTPNKHNLGLARSLVDEQELDIRLKVV